MNEAIKIIKSIAEQTSRVMLFHSGSGKDSIVLLDLLHPYFEEIVCVYMYVVKDLNHINRYIQYAQDKYPKAKFIQVPHFSVYSFIKAGYMGCKKNPKQRLFSMSQIADKLKETLNIEWVFIGFKMSDSMNRRCMLKTYTDDAISESTKRCYPLSHYKNKDVLRYIDEKKLIKPESYGRAQSSGTNITDINYLLFLRNNFPDDLKKILNEYPLVERIIYEYDYAQAK